MAFINSTIEDVRYHLEQQAFDGPLDLLVKMVRESKIDIVSIYISEITDQFVQYVKNMQELDYEYVAEYIILAATLLEIKSSKLLPVEDEFSDYHEELNAIAEKLMSDVEKQLLLSFPDKLRPLETINLFYNEPIYTEKDYKLVAKDLTLDKLLDAYKLVLERIQFSASDNIPKTIVKERFTVADKVKELVSRVRTEGKLRFFSLFESFYSRTEVINVFLAILEVLKKQVAKAEQSGDGDIVLEHNPNDDFNPVQYNDEELAKETEEYHWKH